MSNLIGGIGETLLWSVHICIYSKTTPKKKKILYSLCKPSRLVTISSEISFS